MAHASDPGCLVYSRYLINVCDMRERKRDESERVEGRMEGKEKDEGSKR